MTSIEHRRHFISNNSLRLDKCESYFLSRST